MIRIIAIAFAAVFAASVSAQAHINFNADVTTWQGPTASADAFVDFGFTDYDFGSGQGFISASDYIDFTEKYDDGKKVHEPFCFEDEEGNSVCI